MNKDKKSILIMADWFEPGYRAGGPIRSIGGFVSNLKNEFNIYIVTRDRDLNGLEPYPNIKVDEWNKIDANLSIIYLSPNSILPNIVNKLKGLSFDWMYLNSLFSFKFSIFPYFLVKMKIIKTANVVIAPRGETKKESLLVKPKKKKMYVFIAKAIKFYKNTYWHATSIKELNDINTIFRNQKTLIAPNLRKIKIDTFEKKDKVSNSLKVIFLSRVISYKNLDYAIETFKGFDVKNIQFDIYGPIEDTAYFKKCVKVSKNINHVIIEYKGELQHSEVMNVFSEYDLFFFPTKGENYGHVIAEALMAGCPILMSDQTPWNDIKENNAGWVFSLNDRKSFVNALNEMYLMDNEEFQKKRESVATYAKYKINRKETIQKYIEFFKTEKTD
jgi:glycosyltransferase involved in cell wall biosynthesis